LTLSRRIFLKRGALAGATLVVGVSWRGSLFACTDDRVPFVPNQRLRIHRDGSIVIVTSRLEMGQGVRTSLPMIVAEELGADWERVTVEHAHPGPDFTDMRTAGSGSVSGSWAPLRLAAAAAREMLIGAAALRWEVDPSSCATERSEVVHRSSGRRLSFGRLIAQAARQPVPKDPPLKDPATYQLLGSRIPSVDLEVLCTGQAVFGFDVRIPEMRVATVLRDPAHRGKPVRWSDARAKGVAGVEAVVPISTGIAVVARDTWAALQGRAALEREVEWETGSGDSVAYVRALEEALARGKSSRREGNFARAMGSARRRMSAVYHSPFQAHAAMEPLNCTCSVTPGHCELWVGTQDANEAQRDVAKLLGIPPEQVRVNVTLAGGAFGRRLAHDYIIEAVEISRAIGKPVQTIWTREDDIRHDMYQPGQVNRITAGLNDRGLPVAWRHEVADFNLSMFGPFDPAFKPAADGDPWGGYDTPYSFAALDVTLALAEAPVRTGAWRSVTYPGVVLARECFLDEVARANGADPLALRLELLGSPGMAQVGSLSLPNGDRLRRVLELAADRSGWNTPLPAPRDGRRHGRGIACNGYHQRTMVAQVAEVSVGEAGDVKVDRVVCAVDCGQVINRSGLEAQLEGGVIWALSAALKGEITFADGATRQSNFHNFPVMRMADAPVVEVHVVPSTLRPFGIGEQPVPAVAPAVLNAIHAATGRRIRHYPVGGGELGS
jgi:isoquinoline 1-oxidoreductase beta subunit